MNTERDKYLTEKMGAYYSISEDIPEQDFSTWQGFGKLIESNSIREQVGSYFYRLLGEVVSASYNNVPSRFADILYRFLKEQEKVRIESYLELAKQVSLNSQHKFKIGTVIVKGNRIISVGWNQIRYCRVGRRFTSYPESLHSERDCVRKMNKEDIKGSTIFIFRSYADGSPALAYPCEDCYSMLEALSVKRVVFSCKEYPYWKMERI